MKLDDIRAEFNAAKHGGATPVILAQSLKTVEQIARTEGVAFAKHEANGDLVAAYLDDMPVTVQPELRAGSIRIGTLEK
jgi:hypothetical protein